MNLLGGYMMPRNKIELEWFIQSGVTFMLPGHEIGTIFHVVLSQPVPQKYAP